MMTITSSLTVTSYRRYFFKCPFSSFAEALPYALLVGFIDLRFHKRDDLQPSPVFERRSPYSSRNLMAAYVPSQKGLFFDSPHRQSVTRLRTSY